MWECPGFSDCECSQGELGDDNRDERLHIEELHGSGPETVEDYWQKIISAYSGLILTLSKDKLPALSSVAKHVLSVRLGDEYLAGLWKKTIFIELRWIVWTGDGRWPSTWPSPSWSCTAIDGIMRVSYHSSHSKTDVRDYAQCLDASVTPAGPDPTGELSFGYILRDAPVILTQLEDNPTSNRDRASCNQWCLTAAGLKAIFRRIANLTLMMDLLE